jgi:hypothetical protein
MNRFGAIALVLGIACGATRPPAPSPSPASSETSVAKQETAPDEPKATSKPVIPDTLAGRTLSAWLEAFNSGDEPRMKEFTARYGYVKRRRHFRGDPEPDAGRGQTGGFELIAVQKSDPLFIAFTVQEKNLSTQAVGWLKVKDGDPAVIEMFELLAIPMGTTAADMLVEIDVAMRTRLVEAIGTQLNDLYIYSDVAKRMEESIREHLDHGDYDAFTNGPELAERLTDDLRAVGHDGHVTVDYVGKAPPESQDEPSNEEQARFKEQLERINCGFEKVERLDGQIGYVKFDMFGPVDICGPKATAALASLGDVDALIFDLRSNHGGQPQMVAFVASYLFAKRTHLNDIYERKNNKTDRFWTKPDVPGTKFVSQPVYVLTSSKTFSAAEEFCYDLQTTKRATIVGEVTGGGAHPTTYKRLDDHFMIGVPVARAINPVTKTDWEGKGIQPEIKVSADQALEEAKRLAVEKLAKIRKTPRRK